MASVEAAATSFKAPGSVDRNLILVLGMHRSGTSALTGTLARLGVELGERLLDANLDNQKGYFENPEVVRAQEHLFEAMRVPWHDPRPLPSDWQGREEAKSAGGVIRRVLEDLFSKSHIVAVKDPRSSRLVPLWKEVAPEAGARISAVLMVRHPCEVAASLQRRDGLSRPRSHLLWIRYFLDAERATRGMPRVLLSYEALLEDWQLQVTRIERALDLVLVPPAPEEEEVVRTFLDGTLRRFIANEVSGAPESEFEALALNLYALALRAITDPEAVSQSEFDAIERSADKLVSVYFGVVDDENERKGIVDEELKLLGQLQTRNNGALQMAALRELWRPAQIVRPPGRCKLYFRAENEPFTEAYSLVSDPTDLDGCLKVAFELPTGSPIDHVRIDPDDAPGVFSFLSLHVSGAHVPDFAKRVESAQEMLLPSATSVAVRIAALGDDPYMEVDLRGIPRLDGTSQQLLVEFVFRPETVATELSTQIHDVGLGLRNAYETTRAGQREIEDKIQAFTLAQHGVVDELKQDSSRLLNEMADSRAEMKSLESRLSSMLLLLDERHALAGLDSGSLQKNVEDLRAELAALRDEQREARGESASIASTVARMEIASVQRHEELGRATEVGRHSGVRGLTELQNVLVCRLDRLDLAQSEAEERYASRASETEASIAALGSSQNTLAANIARLNDVISDLGQHFAVLQDHQLNLLRWAQHRSPGYWLHRIGGRLGKTASTRRELELNLATLPALKLANVRRDHGPEGPIWLSDNDDPQLSIGIPAAGLKGGWYCFEAVFERLNGSLVSPCLYPDYGDGCSEAERVFLSAPDSEGRVRSLVRFKRHVTGLRLDPSTRRANFELATVGLRPLDRLNALRSMLGGAGDAGLRDRLSFLWTFLTGAFAGGVREGADRLYDRYVGSQLRMLGNEYMGWVHAYDTLGPTELAALRAEAAAMQSPPLISIVMPVYMTPEKWLRRCIDSILAQAYPNWELCIADDASPGSHVGRVLKEYRDRDRRIRVAIREKNGHIAAASNSALELASGKYIALLDHDDELPPHALLEVARAALAHPEWKIIYSDEDKVDEEGRRFDPYFKPEWNYDLFLSHNCISHLGVYEAQMVRAVGGFREGTEGSQDWDLALRCIETLDEGQVGHIPKVLYHWRAIPGSTALAPGEKNYAHLAAMRVIQAHLDRRGAKANVLEIENHPGNYRVKYELPAVAPKVSLIVPTRDRVDLLRQCIGSITTKTAYDNYEIIVVDNQSKLSETADYFDELRRDPRVSVIRYDAPFNYSAINNAAVLACSGDVVGFINNDIEVINAGWLEEMVSHTCRPGVGAVGAKLYFPDDTIQHAGVILGFNGVGVHAYAGRHREWFGQMLRAKLIQRLSAVTAACMLVRRAAFDAVGGFDEQLQVAYNDVDFCLRLDAHGFRTIWTPHAELYHHESASRGSDVAPEKRARLDSESALMMERWGDRIARDPAYNPNLALGGETFALAFPPR